MAPHKLYEIWAPPEWRWSQWAKPALFLHIEAPREEEHNLRDADVSWAPQATSGASIIVDLPGPRGVACGIALARRGFQPVPLYNTHAHPAGAIDLSALLATMRVATAELQTIRLDPQAPPVFLLDSNRLTARSPLQPRMFDNRWVVFPQDFPSASFMLAQGLSSVVVLQQSPSQPADDLRHVLLRWQEAGIDVRVKRDDDPAPPSSIQVSRPSRFRAMWQRWLAARGLRRNAAGGFGSTIPEPGGGGFA